MWKVLHSVFIEKVDFFFLFSIGFENIHSVYLNMARSAMNIPSWLSVIENPLTWSSFSISTGCIKMKTARLKSVLGQPVNICPERSNHKWTSQSYTSSLPVLECFSRDHLWSDFTSSRHLPIEIYVTSLCKDQMTLFSASHVCTDGSSISVFESGIGANQIRFYSMCWWVLVVWQGPQKINV